MSIMTYLLIPPITGVAVYTLGLVTKIIKGF